MAQDDCSPKYAQAEALVSEAEAAYAANDLSEAERLYGKSSDLFHEVADSCIDEMEEKARAAGQLMNQTMESVRAEAYGLRLWDQGKALYDEGMQLFDARKDSCTQFEKARALFERALPLLKLRDDIDERKTLQEDAAGMTWACAMIETE